jgi:hypothetical protein
MACVRDEDAQVTEAPEVSKMTVFRSGTVKGEEVLMPRGGHIEPISTAGESAKWK